MTCRAPASRLLAAAVFFSWWLPHSLAASSSDAEPAGGTLAPIFSEQESLLDTLSLRLAMLRQRNETLQHGLDASHVDLRTLANRLSTLTRESNTLKKKLLRSETDSKALTTSLTDSERLLSAAQASLAKQQTDAILWAAVAAAGGVLVGLVLGIVLE